MILSLNHGNLQLPAFFPDATRGVVRTVDVKDLAGLIEVKVEDIARYQALQTLEKYDRGIRWDSEA